MLHASCILGLLFHVAWFRSFLIQQTITNLAKTVSMCVNGKDLRALSAFLVAVVCSSNKPPLRSFGSPAEDGAFIILKSLLERATQ